MTEQEQKKIVVPADYKFEAANDSRPAEYDEALNARPNSASTPLSELFSPDDNLCPICHKTMPALIGGIIVRNQEGFVVCKACVRKTVGEPVVQLSNDLKVGE